MSLTLESLKKTVDEQRARDQSEKEELYREVSALVKEKIRESLAVEYLAGYNTLDVDVSKIISEHSGNARPMYTSDMRKITVEVADELRNIGLTVLRYYYEFRLHIEGIKDLSM